MPAANTKPGRGVPQILDQRLAAGDVAAATAERLAERAHPDVDVAAIDAEVLADAAARARPARPSNGPRRSSAAPCAAS